MSAAARMMCSRSRRLIASRGPHASAPRCTSAPAARRRPQKASPASAHAPLPCRRREARKGVQEGPREGAARRARSAGTARMLASTAPCLAHDGGRVDRSAIARRRRDAERDSAPRRDGGDPPHDYSLPADPGVRAIPRSCTRSSARRGRDGTTAAVSSWGRVLPEQVGDGFAQLADVFGSLSAAAIEIADALEKTDEISQTG